MKINKQLLLIFSLLLLTTETIFSQTECAVNPPITDDMFATEGPCEKGGVIFTMEEYQAQSENGSTDFIGIPYSDLTYDPNNTDYSQESHDNVVDLLAGTMGGMSMQDLFDCLDIGCSPHVQNAHDQIGNMASSVNNADLGEVASDANLTPEEQAALNGSDFGSIGEIQGELGGALANINNNFNTMFAEAFGVSVSDCDEEEPWLGMLTDPENPFGGEGGGQMKKKLETRVAEIFETIVSENEFCGDPNWFMGEIEGLGLGGPNSLLPSPTATSTIESVQAGVDLYNGTGSFGLPLDNIGAKDVSVPISVGTTPGGLKVNDQEGVLGSNMNLSAGGKITRVVKGLPDEFNGNIYSHAYGFKRGIKPVIELAGVNVGIEADIPSGFLKRAICKVIQALLKEVLSIETGGVDDCKDIVDAKIKTALDEALAGLAQGENFFPTPEESDQIAELIENLNDPVFIEKLVNGFKIKDGNIGAVKYLIDWKPFQFNYINLTLTATIPLFAGIELQIGVVARAGVKNVDVPSPVIIKKTSVGYDHLMNPDIMGQDGLKLPAININDFAGLSKKEKENYLNKISTTRKRSEREFFHPNAFNYLDMFRNLEEVFSGYGSTSNNFPEVHTSKIDLEPDEYYYEFGGYSGKFYLQPRVPTEPGMPSVQPKVVLVPYQDFIINIEDRPVEGIYKFTFITPEGVEYTFDKVAKSQYVHYTLPSSSKYPEESLGPLGKRENYHSPNMGSVKYPTYYFIQGIPTSLEVRKDFLTNYYIEEAPEYNSAWHVTSVESKITKERVDLEYQERQISYNSQKNWSHTFPNFKLAHRNNQGPPATFKTTHNQDLGAHLIKSLWKNGFSDLTYSMSEVRVTEPYVNVITNNRGKRAEFIYKDNPALVGGLLCERIEIIKNENDFFKGWEFQYETPAYTNVEVTCSGTNKVQENGQSPAYANDQEYGLKMEVDPNENNEEFIFTFPLTIRVICITFGIPLDIRWEAKNLKKDNYYFINKITELTSILHLNDLITYVDPVNNSGGEEARFQAEYVRNFLLQINELDKTESPFNIATLDYNGWQALSSLPKRYGINQDIWGYYNGPSSRNNPFIKESYEPIESGGDIPYNSDHFGFFHEGSVNFSAGRNWESNIEFSKIGQLNRITLETGAFVEYTYDEHEYPLAPSGIFSEPVMGGLRMDQFTKGSENGPTQTIDYIYHNPTVINFPVFTDQHPLNEYYKDLEEKVTTSWNPLNEWKMNKGGYVGYAQVDEVFKENGKVEHYFSNPNLAGYIPALPSINVVRSKYKKLFPFGSFDEETTEESLGNIDGIGNFHPTFAAPLDNNWKLGLELKSVVFDKDGNDLQETNLTYAFPPMNGTNGVLSYPKAQMFQYMHYGSPTDMQKESALYQLVDAGTACPENVISAIAGFLLKNIFTSHPYRYILKDYVHADIIIRSEKIEIRNTTTKNKYDEGDPSIVSSTYEYYVPNGDSDERKLKKVTTTNNGKISIATFEYADNIYPVNSFEEFMDHDLLADLDQEYNYEVPIHQQSYINGLLSGGSITDLALIDNRYLPEAIYGYREGNETLIGVFDSYDSATGLPTKYKLAQYGEGFSLASYEFLPPISMTWNNQLQPLTRKVNEDGDISFTTTNTYEPTTHLVETSTDVNGLTTTYDYDNRHRIEEVVSPGGLQTTHYEYNMNPLTVTTYTEFFETDPNLTPDPNQGQIQEMDGWGTPLKTIRTPDNRIISSTSYDDMWRPIKQYEIGNGTSEIIYEPSPLGRTEKIIDAVGNETITEYIGATIPQDLLDNNFLDEHNGYHLFAGTKVTDPNGHISYKWVEGFGKPSVQISGEKGVTVYNYEGRERIAKIINPIGEEYTYDYNTKTGLLAQKQIPGRQNSETFWYDKAMRMIAKDNGKAIIGIESDEILRPINIRKIDEPSSSIWGVPMAINDASVLSGDILQANVYEPNTMWMAEVTEAVLGNGGIVGTKKMTYSLDDYGRVNSINSKYSHTGHEAEQIFTPIKASGISENVTKVVTGPDGIPVTNTYTYTFDNILRPLTTSLTYNQETNLLEELEYNDFDQVKLKKIGFNPTHQSWLQTVSYTHDDAGRLTNINDPFDSGCVSEATVCQLYWGSGDKPVDQDFDETGCGLFIGITLDGTLYEMPSPMPASQIQLIEAFINEAIALEGRLGGAEVHYENFLGVTSDFYLSIMKTNISTATIHFENCNYNLDQKDCCEIIAMGQNGILGAPESAANPSLFFEQITYDGLDISLIEMAGSCTAGLVINHYSYDADHRLTNVHNELFNPEKIAGALSTSYTYDPAGNIMTLKRNGWVPQVGEFMEIDNLVYTYQDHPTIPNRHLSVLERVKDDFDTPPANWNPIAQPIGFKGNDDGIAEYQYNDGNGNLTNDFGKNATINYNLLNLPESITLSGGSITHEYTFSGAKYRKNGEDNRYYIEGFEYSAGELELINIPNGRILHKSNESPRYQYNLTDHLGNIVVIFEDANGNGIIQIEEETGADSNLESEVLQRNHYYSFGMRVEAPGLINNGEAKNKYLYNEKELNLDFGFDWHDYGARYYDATIARWGQSDPLAEHQNQIDKSLYAYVWNNPVGLNDPDGRCPKCPDEIYVPIAENAYSAKLGDKTENGWEAIDVNSNPFTGFKGVLYKGTYEGQTEYIYATAGTDSPVDAIEDIDQVLGDSKQMYESIAFATKNAEEYSGLSFTGHSLGGGLASANALAVEGKAVTFNAAGLSRNTKIIFNLLENTADITAYIVEGEAVHEMQSLIGIEAEGKRQIFLPATGGGAIKNHLMEAVKDGFKIYNDFIKKYPNLRVFEY